ncbi:MAG: zinc ribbon domain-containing protein [Pseudomonadota bacterium]|nr:MAG: zinc ribbon domain-containing protein [Desulfobacteraceae bacterium]
MPIYEFKCLKCEEFFEMLVMGNAEQNTMQCPKCKSEDFERVLSTTNYSMPGGGSSAGTAKGAGAQTRTCSSGSCTTYNIPGPK